MTASGGRDVALGVHAFVVVALRRFASSPSALFFSLALPVVVITIIGSTFGGGARVDVGVAGDVSSPFGARIVRALEAVDGVDVHRVDDLEALRRAARRNAIGGGIVLPEALATPPAAGSPVPIPLVLAPDAQRAFASRAVLQLALERAGAAVGAAAFAAAIGDGSTADLLARADALDTASGPAVEPAVRVVGDASPQADDAFARVAPQNLVLFVFLTGLSTGGLLVYARRNGILRRALAAPHGPGVVIAGLALGWLCVELVQSALIVLVGAVVFGVDWGDPLAAALLVLALALLACAAGLVVGVLAQDADRLDAVVPITGIVLGALGGCMVPLEVFPPVLDRVAYLTPHAWALRGWRTLTIDGGGVAEIAPSLLVLGGASAVVLGLAAALLRRDLAR